MYHKSLLLSRVKPERAIVRKINNFSNLTYPNQNGIIINKGFGKILIRQKEEYMSTREYAINIINTLSDEQLEAFIDFISAFADRSMIAKIESNALESNPNPKCYNNFREFMEEMEKDNGV